jgi:Sulfatase
MGEAWRDGCRDITAASAFLSPAQAQQQKANILVIMGDDVGWFNIGAYHRGIRASKTPNLDQLAAEGMMFTDYYAEVSCTVGRAASTLIITPCGPKPVTRPGCFR